MTDEFKKQNEQTSDKDLINEVVKETPETSEKKLNRFIKSKKVLLSISVIIGVLIAVAVAGTIISPENSIISIVKNTVKKDTREYHYMDGSDYYHSSEDCERFKLDQITGFYYRKDTVEEIKLLFKDVAPCPECVD